MPQAMIPVELGVCELGNNTQGNWGYHIIGIPASTPGDQIHDAATRAFLEKHETILVHHTWLAGVGSEALLGAEDDEGLDLG